VLSSLKDEVLESSCDDGRRLGCVMVCISPEDVAGVVEALSDTVAVRLSRVLVKAICVLMFRSAVRKLYEAFVLDVAESNGRSIVVVIDGWSWID